jgi:hypothetical protein
VLAKAHLSWREGTASVSRRHDDDDHGDVLLLRLLRSLPIHLTNDRSLFNRGHLQPTAHYRCDYSLPHSTDDDRRRPRRPRGGGCYNSGLTQQSWRSKQSNSTQIVRSQALQPNTDTQHTHIIHTRHTHTPQNTELTW